MHSTGRREKKWHVVAQHFCRQWFSISNVHVFFAASGGGKAACMEYMTRGVMRRQCRWVLVAVFGLMLCGVPALRADDAGPGEWVARLSAVDGQVRVLVAGEPVVDQALVNLPVSVGTEIVTGDDGRAEIEFEDGTVARIAPNSGMRVIALRGSGGQSLQLEGGLGYFETRTGTAMVRFGTAVANVDSSTLLRLRLDAPPGEAAVLSGVAEIKLDKGASFTLAGGQSATLSAEDPNQYATTTLVRDSWDAWNQDRNQALVNEASASTGALAIDNGTPAWSDLDANGSWYPVPGVGEVWSPRVASAGDWEPYGCGHWVWTPRFGYVWVSCWQWGFMPYMCGNWDFYDGFGWGWSPYGCGAGWGGGFFTTVRVRRGPPGYRPLPHPGPRPRRPIGEPRPPHPPVIPIDRKGPGHERLPERGAEASIGGTILRPLPPLHPIQSRAPGQSDLQRGAAPGIHPGPKPVVVPMNEPRETVQHPGVGDPQRDPRPGNSSPTAQPARHGFWQEVFHSSQQPHSAPASGGSGAQPSTRPSMHAAEPRGGQNNQPQNTPRGMTGERSGAPTPSHTATPTPQHFSAPAPAAQHFSAPPPPPAVHVSAPAPAPAASGGSNTHK